MPTKFTVVAGSGTGETKLNAFDKALLAAGIGNLNLLKVSSILPPGSLLEEEIHVQPGSLLPVAYASITSDTPGERIAAAVAVGRADQQGYGVIMEFSGPVTKQQAERNAVQMVQEAMAFRGLDIAELYTASADQVVEQNGCAFAAVALWY